MLGCGARDGPRDFRPADKAGRSPPSLAPEGRQATEVAIAANALNRMLDLGRPRYVRVA